MRIDINETDGLGIHLFEYQPIATGDINRALVPPLAVKPVVIQKRVVLVGCKQLNALLVYGTDILWEPSGFLDKAIGRHYVHTLSRPRRTLLVGLRPLFFHEGEEFLGAVRFVFLRMRVHIVAYLVPLGYLFRARDWMRRKSD